MTLILGAAGENGPANSFPQSTLTADASKTPLFLGMLPLYRRHKRIGFMVWRIETTCEDHRINFT